MKALKISVAVLAATVFTSCHCFNTASTAVSTTAYKGAKKQTTKLTEVQILDNYLEQQIADLNAIEGADVHMKDHKLDVTFDSGILFTTNKADLKPEAKTAIDQMIAVLKKYPGTKLTVEGHTDADGADDYNQTLSEKRATAVSSYVGSHGIDPSLLSAIGFGETKPVGDNATAEGKAKNRRVEVLLEVTKSYATKLVEASATNDCEDSNGFEFCFDH